MANATLDATGSRVNLNLSLEESTAIEAILSAIDFDAHPELSNVTWLAWNALRKLRQDRPNSDAEYPEYFEMAEEMLGVWGIDPDLGVEMTEDD